jgi:inner membrane protein involved in colicin E2 resistance
METKSKIAEKISQSITLKAFIIGFMTLILLIPGFLIQDLIRERQQRSNETIQKESGSETGRTCAGYSIHFARGGQR